MQQIGDIARQIVAREGGYVNDPDDPGGPTKHGVTLATLRRLKRDLDGDGRVDLADLHRLDRGEAARIFLDSYFYGPGLDALPEVIQPPVFDMQVNAGPQAVRLLQRLLNRMGFSCRIDGRVGPETIGAARRAAEAAPDHLADAYGIERRNYYYRLAEARPALRKYARRRDGGKGGWIRRAEAFLSPRYRLSEAQHRERVQTW
jgi:lysozyme family protein